MGETVMDVDKKFEESIENALSDSDKLMEVAFDKDFSENADLLRASAADIRGLTKLVRVYDKNIKNALKQMLDMNRTAADLGFKNAIMAALLDQETNDAVELLASKRKEFHNDSGGTAE